MLPISPRYLLCLLWLTLPLIARGEVPQAMPAEERLEKSDRHHEFVDLETETERKVRAFVVFPEVDRKVPAVVVIHENRGLNAWARSLSDQLAEAGYLAIAPDMLTGAGPDGGDTSSFASADDARTALYRLTQEQISADINAAIAYAADHEAADGRVIVIGFCWGGSQTFHAAGNAKVTAACVFYGSAPDEEVLRRIEAPLYGFYGGNDFRITGGVPALTETLQRLEKPFEAVTYAEAGHGFMRTGEDPEPAEANRLGRQQAWQRLLEILKRRRNQGN